MDTPLISIITITYNASKVLPVTIRSVMEQDYSDFEHLIIDGASTDDTLEIARSNPGARILSEKDAGLYDAMNKGLRMARGKYVLFLNAGDSFRTKDTLSNFAREAEKDKDIIYADTMVVDSNGKDIAPRHHTAPDLLTFESFSKGMLVCHQAFMVKKEIAPEYDLSYRFSADYDWTVKCIKNTTPERCVNLNYYAINYLSDGLTDKNKMKSLRERYRIMSRHYGYYPTLLHHIKLVLGIKK
ncbi:MAG: glycosyltransferase [Muribaculaceae bacterium]|nr:glycosyltransferase [Muribaculaceae bacterium]